MTTPNLNAIEAVTEALGANQMLDAVLGKLDVEKIEEVVQAIMQDNGLGE